MPVVRIGRIAGQYAKPRSSPTEKIGDRLVPSFRWVVKRVFPHFYLRAGVSGVTTSMGVFNVPYQPLEVLHTELFSPRNSLDPEDRMPNPERLLR
jgi:hypothetical protein